MVGVPMYPVTEMKTLITTEICHMKAKKKKTTTKIYL